MSNAVKDTNHTTLNMLAAAQQRARLLVNGVAGPLSERQRALALDLLHDLEFIHTHFQGQYTPEPVERSVFVLGEMAKEVVSAYRFVARRKQLAITLLGHNAHTMVNASRAETERNLHQAVKAAVEAAAPGTRVGVEISRSMDRFALDVSTTGWNPRLPPAPPAGSGLAISILRTASGARLVLSAEAATT